MINIDVKKMLPKHKAGLTIFHNPHKTEYQTVEKYCEINLHDDKFVGDGKRLCIESDELWLMEWYPDTPVGMCVVASSTFEGLFDD